MKKTKIFPRLLILLGLLTLFCSAALAEEPSYQVFYRYDESLCSFSLENSGESVQSGDYVSRIYYDPYYGEDAIPLVFYISDIAEGYRIKEVLVNGIPVSFSTQGYFGEGVIILTCDSSIVVNMEEIPDDLPSIAGVDLYTLRNDIDEMYVSGSINFEYGVYERLWAQVRTSDGGLSSMPPPPNDDYYYPDSLLGFQWEFSLDGNEWISIPYEYHFEFYAPSAGLEFGYEEGYFMDLQNYYLRIHVTAPEGNFAGDAYSAPILVNPTGTVEPPVEEPENGYRLTFIYDSSLCDFSVYDWYTDIPVKNGGILPINENDNRAYGVMEIENIKEGYRIKDFLINGRSFASMMIDGAYGGGATTISKDSTLEVVLEEIPDPLAMISSVSVHLAANDGAPISEVKFVPGELDRIYASVKFADESANYPDYFSTCLWEYSTDDGVTWTEVPGWGRSTQFYADWDWFTERYDIDFMTMQNYYLRVCVSPKNYYSTTPNGGYVYSAPILVNPSGNRYTVTCDVNGGEALENNRLVTNAEGKLPSLPIPRWLGYRFDGWFTEPSAGDTVTSNTVFEQDSTIFAHWATAHPMSSAQICPDYQSVCEVEIIQDGADLSIHVNKTDENQDLSRFSSWVASYDDEGRMTGLQFLTGTITPDGIRFDGNVTGAGDKLFLLSGEMIPVIKASESE